MAICHPDPRQFADEVHREAATQRVLLDAGVPRKEMQYNFPVRFSDSGAARERDKMLDESGIKIVCWRKCQMALQVATEEREESNPNPVPFKHPSNEGEIGYSTLL